VREEIDITNPPKECPELRHLVYNIFGTAQYSVQGLFKVPENKNV
jgi:hypothetical protein